jgi:hypothetical protein
MELDFDDSVVRGLRGYVRLVSMALGLRGESSSVQGEPVMSAYIAVDGRLSDFPDGDVALLWDERHGWSAGIETHSGADVRVVASLGPDVLPPPETVAAWVRELFRSQGEAIRAETRPQPSGSVRKRLAGYLGRFDDEVTAGAALRLYVTSW